MVVCGDDALAQRLASELRDVYRERVTLVVPPAERRPAMPLTGRARATALLGRMSAAMGRGGANGGDEPERLIEAPDLTDEVLLDAGVEHAGALALVHDDDEANIRAALSARRLNPRLALVIRLYNRKLGQYLKDLLDQAAVLAEPDAPDTGPDAQGFPADSATTVLSDADTAAPSLAATAVAGTSKVIQADGLLLRAAERQPPRPGAVPDPGLCTLALLSSTSSDPQGAEGSDDSRDAPQLLPDDATVAAASDRGTVVLEAVSHAGPAVPPGRRLARRGARLSHLFSLRLRWSLFGLIVSVLVLAMASSWLTDDHPLHAIYLAFLDLFSINEPATEGPLSRQILQLLSGFVGLLLLPVLLAAVLEALGAFRSASSLHRPPRGLAGHVVLLGLGKIGTRVLADLRELDIPVVCVEEDPEARGIALARRLRVPVVLGDVTQDDVLEAAKVHRAHALLALTSIDTTNLESALYARTLKPGLRVALRLYDDEFATAVYRTLRAAHPDAFTRSRSVTSLAAPSFAAAMMGRQILGAVPVERRVLLFAAVEVAGHPLLEGHSVADTFRPGHWRVIALDSKPAAEGLPDLTAAPSPYTEEPHEPRLIWDMPADRVLTARDRVVVAATRRGLAELLGHGNSPDSSSAARGRTAP
ncbi:potassium transporter peripheral membrane component [Streptomyces sp. YIM 130001]|uniref:NAD-binding protein n=1 Tax=Streptomyces sp. YIM 130001 TaxID=2259644 RepID=UPI000E64A136|nr:NAD-binding protein [Streptomyces sp. YIM 130001]RII09204.1 potassium transporter peripheral membrane component [Streptomyces sp. YIM 130001]